jgi:hypothetical protein
MIPHPASLLSRPRGRASGHDLVGTAGTGARKRGFTHPPRPPLPPASPPPEPPFEVENLGCGAQPGPEESLRRQQRDVMTGGAVHL